MWSYDENFVRNQVGPALHQEYFDAGRIAAEDTDYDVWPSRVMANIYQNNLQPDEALGKVVRELRQQLNPQPPSNDFEHGQLTARDGMFFDENGNYYNSLCISSFQLLKLLVDGNHNQFDKVIDQAIQLGFREFRVLASFKGELGELTPKANYFSCVDLLISIMEQVKKRLELVIFADAQNWIPNPNDQNIFLTNIAGHMDGHVLVNGELANEYPKNGIDPTRFTRPNTTNLWSSGSGLGDQNEFPTVWDYITYHEGRPDDWPRRNNCRDIRTTYGVPVRSDEPMGAGPVNIPGKRSNNPRDFYEFASNQALNSNGFTFHPEVGIYSNLLSGVELDCAIAAVEGFNTVSAEWFTGSYTRGGLSDCPLEHNDNEELRTFCRIRGGQARCIVIRSNHNDRESRNGWSVEKLSGSIDQFVELELA